MEPLTKFQRIVNRLMTCEEAREKCKMMGLSDDLTDYIAGKFDDAHSYIENDDDVREEDNAGENGEICYGQIHESEYLNLKVEMGYDEDEELSDEDNTKVERVWTAFFSE